MEIHAPDSTFEGKSRYGDLELEFEAGVAQHDGDLPDAVRSYMVGAGYGIDEAAPEREPAPEPVDHPRESRVGTPLADAEADKPKRGRRAAKPELNAEEFAEGMAAAEQAPDAEPAQDN